MVATVANWSVLSERFPSLSRTLDENNFLFTSETRTRLRRLRRFSEASLDWLMMEHYQFSRRNPAFLATAATATEALPDKAVSRELARNFNEEKSHAALYRRALMDVGTDVTRRLAFAPTDQFFEKIQSLLTRSPRCALGTMYATETAAIFEHEVFLDISREVVTRRGTRWSGSRLKAFHDMHLAGVEQSHKDGLAGLVDRNSSEGTEWAEIFAGADEAIDAMRTWWNTLLQRAAET